MALHRAAILLGQRGLVKLLEHTSRPAGIALSNAELRLQTGEELLNGSHLQQAAFTPGSASADTQDHPAFAVTARTQLRTFASAAAVNAVRGEGSENQSETPNEEGEGRVVGAEKTQKQSGRKEGRNGTVSYTRLKNAREAREELLQRLREAPVGADLNQLFADGKVSGEAITGKMVQSALYEFVGYFDGVTSQLQGESEGAEEQKADFLPTLEYKPPCTYEDARRALSLFEWWQGKKPETPQVWLLNPLLKSLAQANLVPEIEALWETYKGNAKGKEKIVPNFLLAFFAVKNHERVVEIHREAVASGGLMTPKGTGILIRSLHDMGAPSEELYAAYKELVNLTGEGLLSRVSYSCLIRKGVSVEQIEGLQHKKPDHVARKLIQALLWLGRREEAEKMADRFADPEQPKLDRLPLCMILVTLVGSGFKQQAQKLVDLQREKYGTSLADALIFFINKNHQNVQIGHSAYKLLMELEGEHRTSFSLQVSMIKHVHFRLKDADAILEAYRLATTLEGTFVASTYGQVIYVLALADRVADAEAVLGDYYQARQKQTIYEDMGTINESVYHRLVEMYIRASQPDKVVDLVRGMVETKYWVNPLAIKDWSGQLRGADFESQAEQVEILGEDMESFRPPKVERKGERHKPRSYLRKDGSKEAGGQKGESAKREKQMQTGETEQTDEGLKVKASAGGI